jgi:hypothetical protein
MASRPTRNLTSTRTSLVEPGKGTRRPSLYERAVQQRVERARKLKLLEAKLMEECTFTPTTTTSRSSTVSSSPSSGESVFDRLYRGGNNTPGSNHSTPVTSNVRRGRSNYPTRTTRAASPMSSRMSSSRPESTYSSRIEGLYESGVRKIRARPLLNDSREKQLRDVRREEQNMAECTFQPSLRKGRKSKLVMEPHRRRPQKLPDALPLEIRVSNKAWESPLREEWRHRAVSPLREDSLGDFGPPSAAKTAETEYGSI